MHLSLRVLLDDQIDIRCDRVTCESKIGALICVPNQINPTNVHKFVTSSIEVVSATIQLPNREHLQIAVVYRSPSVPKATLLTLLTQLLTYMTQCAVPCVILGNFNEDILHCENSATNFQSITASSRLCIIQQLHKPH